MGGVGVDQLEKGGWLMPAIFDLLYREYCRARLAEMRKQLLISPERHEAPEAICDAKDAVGASPASHVSGGRSDGPVVPNPLAAASNPISRPLPPVSRGDRAPTILRTDRPSPTP